MSHEADTTRLIAPERARDGEVPDAPPLPRTAWRVAAYTEWEQLSDELSRVPPPADEQARRNHEIASKRLDEAQAAFSAPYRGHRLELFYSGAQIERTWSCLHEAGRALLMLLDDAALRARIPSIRRAVLEHLDAKDPQRTAALADLERIERGEGEIAPADRECLRAIRALADAQSDLYQRDVRAFRNLLLIFSVALGVLLIVVAVVHAIDSSLISLCAKADPALNGDLCPHGANMPGRFDVLEVELVGAVGGLLAAIIPLAKARRLPGPYGLAVVQSALKAAGGATIAFVAVLLLQGGVLAGLSPQPGSHVLAYAAFFGLAQQALTMLVDRRVGELASSPTPKGGGDGDGDRPGGR